MRIALSAVAAASALASTPALAAEGDAARLAEELRDPAMQAEIAAMVETMSAVMLDMNVAPLLKATATIEGRDPEAVAPEVTVRDLAGPEAEQAPHAIATRLPQMMGAMAALAGSLEAMLPQLRAMGETLAHPPVSNRTE